MTDSEAQSIQERILEAARTLFLTKGYHGSNLRDIARAAQVSMGGIYHHFGSKEEIYHALLHATAAPEALGRIVAHFQVSQFPDNLGEIGEAIFEVARAHRDYFKLMYIDVVEFQSRNVSQLISGFRKGFNRVASDLLAHRQASGELSSDVHPAVMLRCMFDLFLYFVLEEVMLDTSLASELGMTDRELADQMARMVLRGAKTRPEPPTS
jgi:AcrR family transcriptional regulator